MQLNQTRITENEFNDAMRIVRDYQIQKRTDKEINRAKKNAVIIVTTKFDFVSSKTKIRDLGLSARLFHAVRAILWNPSAAEIIDGKWGEDILLEDIVKIKESELIKIRNTGIKSIIEFRQLLNAFYKITEVIATIESI